MSIELNENCEELVEKFHRLSSIEDVADLLEVDLSHLRYYLYWMPDEQRYSSFTIPKKSGGVRTICAPNSSIKILQHKLNQVLQCVYQPKPSIHGFVSKRSIVSNAEAHMGRKRKYVLNIDLEDFFPSINFGRVRGMFMKYPYELPEEVATVLAQICCFENQLPQGAPTSPTISNMICAKMDSQLQHLAQENRCFYTRYADDITFSTSMPNFPHELAETRSYPTGLQLEVGSELNRIVTENGFKINSSKVRLQTSDRRQEITGLVVNEKPNVPRKFIRQIRAMLHAWKKFDLELAELEYLSKYRSKNRFPNKSALSFRAVLRGKIEYLGMVRGKSDSLYQRYLSEFKALENPNGVQPPVISVQGKIFVSYSRKDEDFARKLALSLAQLGVAVWIDTEDIPIGVNWSTAIQEGLNICDTMIVIVTPDSMASKNVAAEWQTFYDEGKSIVPLLLKETDDKLIHYQLRRIQRIDFRAWITDFNSPFAQLCRGLQKKGISLSKL